MYFRVIFGVMCMLMSAGIVQAAPFAYIANNTDATVSILDTASNTVSATITVGQQPYGVAVNAMGSRVYVSNQTDKTISVIDTMDNSVSTIALANTPGGLAVNAAGTRLFVADNDGASLSVYDTATKSKLTTVSLGYNLPEGVAVGPATGGAYAVYVSCSGSNKVVVVDANDGTSSYAKSATEYTVGSTANPGPMGLAVMPNGSKVYVANWTESSISVINTSTSGVSTIASGSGIAALSLPFGVAVSPDGLKVYVSNSGALDTISVIATASDTVTAAISVGQVPMGVAISPDGTKLVAANSIANTASVINPVTNTVSATPAVGQYPNSLGNFAGPVFFNITATPGSDGTITPLELVTRDPATGIIKVAGGLDLNVSITSDHNYATTDVTVDGGSVGTPATYLFPAVSAAHTVSATFSRTAWDLALTKTGNGTGRVVSSVGGLDCGTACTGQTVSIPMNTANVVLTPSDDSGMYFIGWSGACTTQRGTAVTPPSCTIALMDADKTASAHFVALPGGPVRVGTAYYQTLQDAYTAAAEGAQIDVQTAQSFALAANLAKTVTLVGGWATDWLSVPAGNYATITGGLTISSGAVIIGSSSGGALVIN